MVEEKKKETKSKTTTKKKTNKQVGEIEKFSISELLGKNQIKPLFAIGFLDYYGLSEDFKKEVENNEKIIEFSDEEFNNMYEEYIKREI